MPRKKHIEDSDVLKLVLNKITEKGANNFSLEDLRASTGLSPATLIQRFGSKQNILHKAIALSNVNWQAPEHVSSPLAAIVQCYLSHTQLTHSHAEVANYLTILQLDIIENDLNQLVREYSSVRRQQIMVLLQSAKQAQQIAANVDEADVLENLEALWLGSLVQWGLTGEGELQNWVASRLVSYLRNYNDSVSVAEVEQSIAH